MNIQQVTNSQNFEGKLIELGKFSNKPAQSLKSIRKDLQTLIEPQEFDLYVKQDYATNEIKMVANKVNPFEGSNQSGAAKLLITSKASKYIDAAKSAIENHKKAQYERINNEISIKQKQEKKQQTIDLIEAIFIGVPIMIVSTVAHSISPKFGKKTDIFIDKMLDKI